MGNACRKNKAKEPKRKDIDELAEKERLEKEQAEQEAMKAQEEPEEVVEEPEEPEEVVEEPVEEPEEEEEPQTERIEEETEKSEEKAPSEKSNSDIYSQSEKFDNASEKVPSSTELTLSTEATGVQPVTKLSEPAHEESIHSTYRSVTPCDMNKVDETAKVCSQKCGCDLGDRHDENNCKICRKIDLSDTPLLN